MSNPNAFRVLNADGTEPDFDAIVRESMAVFGVSSISIDGLFVGERGYDIAIWFSYDDVRGNRHDSRRHLDPRRFRVEFLNQRLEQPMAEEQNAHLAVRRAPKSRPTKRGKNDG